MQTPPADAPAPVSTRLEVLDHSLRHPRDQDGAARAEPRAVLKSKAHWLCVQCRDKPGSLAEIAKAIAQHEQNIKVGEWTAHCFPGNSLRVLKVAVGDGYLECFN